jgi:hypothetical protein
MRTENYYDLGPRRSGRTTRIVDQAIQELFKNGYVFCRDHYPSKQMTEYVFKKVLKRLDFEHGQLPICKKCYPECIVALNPKKLREAILVYKTSLTAYNNF